MGVRDRLHRFGIAQLILMLSLLPMLLLFIAIFTFLLSARLDDLERMQRERGELLAKQLAVASEFAVLTGNQTQLRELLSRTATSSSRAAASAAAARRATSRTRSSSAGRTASRSAS